MGDVAHGESSTGFVETGTRKHITVVMLIAMDMFMLMVATMSATYISFHNLAATADLENISAHVSYNQIAWVAVLIWLFFLWRDGLYDLDRLFWGSGEFSRVVEALALGVVAFILGTYALHLPGLSRTWTVLAFAFSVVCVSAGRMWVRYILRSLRRRGRLLRRTLIVGSNAEASKIIRLLQSTPETGLVPIGCLESARFDRLSLDFCGDEVPFLGEAGEVAQVVRELSIDTVIIASSAFDHEIVSQMIGQLRGLDVTTHVSSGLFEILTRRVIVRELAGVPLITISACPCHAVSCGQARFRPVSCDVRRGHRPADMAAVGIRDQDGEPRPDLYKQTRVGQGGKHFGMYKFRSMCDDADERLSELRENNEATGPLFKMKNDPRVTRVGRWMRKFSIDEFPQLLNVLRGEMSLVGPRPPLPGETLQYNENHWRRMEVPPGMTGLWQVSGRSSLTFEEMVRLDLYYIENWSVHFDAALIIRTIPAVLFARGAY